MQQIQRRITRLPDIASSQHKHNVTCRGAFRRESAGLLKISGYSNLMVNHACRDILGTNPEVVSFARRIDRAQHNTIRKIERGAELCQKMLCPAIGVWLEYDGQPGRRVPLPSSNDRCTNLGRVVRVIIDNGDIGLLTSHLEAPSNTRELLKPGYQAQRVDTHGVGRREGRERIEAVMPTWNLQPQPQGPAIWSSDDIPPDNALHAPLRLSVETVRHNPRRQALVSYPGDQMTAAGVVKTNNQRATRLDTRHKLIERFFDRVQ